MKFLTPGSGGIRIEQHTRVARPLIMEPKW